MKKIAMTFVGLLLAQSVVHAQMEGYRKISETDLAKYKEAILGGMTEGLKKPEKSGCVPTGELVKRAEAIYIQDSSAQPLLIAQYTEGYTKFTAVMTSDAEYKKVLKVTQQRTVYSSSRVNQGDLRNPVMVNDTVGTTTSIECGSEATLK